MSTQPEILDALMGREKTLQMLLFKRVRILPNSPWLREHENHHAIIMHIYKKESLAHKPGRLELVVTYGIEAVCSCRERKDRRIPPQRPSFLVTLGDIELVGQDDGS